MIINSRNDKSMPMNSEIMFDVSRIIRPKKLVVPYYTLGVENVAWVEGLSAREGARSKESDHLYLLAGQADNSATWSYCTVLVDLTNIKTLFIDWENTGNAFTSNNRSYFQASTSANASFNSFVAQLNVTLPFARRVDELDVSAISGEYHVIVMARDNGATLATSEIRTYRVWGEG